MCADAEKGRLFPLDERNYEELRGRAGLVWIDVRSPGEFRESTIPGARNVALFDDEERARIGIAYKRSRAGAVELGLELASRKLPELVRTVRREAGAQLPVIFCWRGGMRSRTLATVLDLLGHSCVRLTGGYRAYRQYVTARLAQARPEDVPRAIVLHGMTGVGKTRILQELACRGEPVLDLEALAGHRGSVFGGIGLDIANQRTFDSRLLDELDRLRGAPYVFLEAESRRIGRATMPDFLIEAKRGGEHVELTASLSVRVSRTLDQYRLDDPDEFALAVGRALEWIDKRFSPDLRARVREWYARRAYEPLIRALLTDYYDPRYRHAMEQYGQPFLCVDADDPDAACDLLQVVARRVSAGKKAIAL